MKNFVLFIVLFFVFSGNLFAMTFDQNASGGERLYVFLTKEYRVGYDCKEVKTEFTLFEFISGRDSKKKFYKFVDEFIEGLNSKQWKIVYFPRHYRGYYGNLKKTNGYTENQLSPNFYYYLKKDGALVSYKFFYKLMSPPDGVKVEVRVEEKHHKHGKDFAQFYLGDDVEFSKFWNYGKSSKKFGKLISEKIDLRLYRSKKLKTRKDCTYW